MRFGMHLRELWRLRLGVAACLLLAVLVTVPILYRVSLSPPALTPRTVEMATASTHVLVDTPKSTVLDLTVDTYDFESLSNRAALIGNVMASAPVRASIAKRAGLPPDVVQAATPLTPEFPRPRANSQNEKHAKDILKSNDQYRLSIQANPTVPILDVFAQAPTAASAEKLANAAVEGLRMYMKGLAAEQDVDADRQVTLKQLGPAEGEVINGGVRQQIAGLAFVIVFALLCAALLAISRGRRGWKAAAPPPDAPPPGPYDRDAEASRSELEGVGAR